MSPAPSNANLKESLIHSNGTSDDNNFEHSLFDDMYDPNQLGNSGELPNMKGVFSKDIKDAEPIKMEEKHSDRFLILTLFSFCMLINSASQVTFVPIHRKVLFGYNCVKSNEAVTDNEIDFINW